MRLPRQVKEFFTATQRPFSYNPFRNLYIWFGLLWGLPIPFVTIMLEAYFSHKIGQPFSFIKALHTPHQLLFMCHPFFFGMLFGVLGSIRQEKEQELKNIIQELNDLTIHDLLTGLKNRRYFVEIFDEEVSRSRRRDETFTLLFLDIDHFKKINDTHGHHIGDVVLSELGDYLTHQCRPYDTAVRWGGEEFLILLRATDEKTAIGFANRIREGISRELPKTLKIPLTISIGLAEYQTEDTLETLTNRADTALYMAKQRGRNRVIAFSSLDKSS